MKILFLSRWFPFPTNNGAKIRIYQLLQGLASVHDVTLLCFSDPPIPDPYPVELMTVCREIHAVEWTEFQPGSLRAITGVFSSTPRSLADTYSADMERELRKALDHSYDLIICSEWIMAAYCHLFGHVPVLYEEIEVGVPFGNYTGAQSTISRFRNWLTWVKYRHFLKKLLPENQTCTVVSEQEKKILSTIIPRNRSIFVIPNCVDLIKYDGVKKEEIIDNSLIFTGSFRYRPNYEAMVWFLGEIFPLIREKISEVSLTITGDHANLPLPPVKNVNVTGYVDDVRPYLARSYASVVPLLTGGGTRLKILEAMALGVPVICTSKGAEGLDVEDGEHLLVADKPSEFAAKSLMLLNDRKLRATLAINAHKLVQQKYDWAVVMPEFLRLVESVSNSHKLEVR